MSTDVQAAAAALIANGFAVQPIRPGEKVPRGKGWSTRSAAAHDFQDGDSVCTLLGWPSGNLVCVDLDNQQAVANADQHLPPTGMMDGRLGKPNSHRYYRVIDIPPAFTGPADPGCQSAQAAEALGVHPGPRKVAFKDEAGKVIVEMLGSGQQVVCPPSIHPSGELRVWHGGTTGEPAVIDFTALHTAVRSLAVVCGYRPPDVAETKVPQPPPPEFAETKAPQPPDDDGLDVPPHERLRPCHDYLDSIPNADLSRTGRGGHDECYRIARLIANDFAIRDSDTALSLLRRYNERLREVNDAWTDDELRHKLDAARSAPCGDDHGCKLVPLDPPMAWNNPQWLAGEFLRTHILRCLHSTPFLYTAGHYRPLGKDEFKGAVRRFVQRQAVAEHAHRTAAWDAVNANGMTPKEMAKHNKGKPVVASVSREMVAVTEESVRAATQLPGTTQPGTWLANPRAGCFLAVANGLLELRSGQLIPPSAGYFTLAALPVAFDPAAQCPEWLKFIADTTQGDASKAAVLQEVAGACLDANLPIKFFAVLSGGGDNGKSVFLNGLRFVLGAGNCAAVPLDDLAGSKFAAFGLLGKLANLVGDQNKFDSHDEGRLKQLTGGDLYTFEQKGRDALDAPNTAKLLFSCNTVPTFGDKSEAVWNRLQLVPFTWTVPADRKNPALLKPSHWQSELPGVLNWMLAGLHRLYANGRFTASAACQAAKEQHRTDSNPAREFLMGRCEYTGNDKDKLSVPELYQCYRTWCTESGYKFPLSMNHFNKEVRRAFPGLAENRPGKINGQPVRCWHGLRDITAGETVPAGGLQSYGTVTEPGAVL